MRRPARARFAHFVACLSTLMALGANALAPSPARADATKIEVRPADMAAAQAANKKAAEARKLLKERKHAEGVKMLDEAVGELERTTGPDSALSKANRDAVVSVYKLMHEPQKAEATLARAEAARKTWKAPTAPGGGGAMNPNTASAMQKMQAGLVALKANDFTKAAELLEQALPDVAKSDVSEKNYLLVAGILASLYDYSQQFSKGEALRKDVIARMEKKLGADSPELADQYASLATHYMMRADTAKAAAAQKKSVEITREAQPGTPALADRLLTLADLYVQSGDFDAGQPALLEGMNVVRGITPPDVLRMVRLAHMLATLYDGELKLAEGDKAAEMACSLAKQAGKAEILEEAETDCIRTAIAKGDTRAAGDLAGTRFARFEKRYGSSGPIFANAAHELARVRWVEGRKDEATGLARRAAEAQEKHLVRLLSASGDAEKRAQLNLIASEASDLLTMGGAGNGGSAAQTRLALETILRRKGRSLDASADAARVVRLFEKPADKALASRQVEVRRQIAALGLRGGAAASAPPGVDPGALLARLEAEDDDLGNKLAAASPIYRAQERPVTIEAVQAAIPDDTALVEYVYYLPRDTTSARFAPKGVSFVAFVLHKTGEPVAVDLGDGLPIGRSIDELRKALSEHGDVLPNARRVHDLVVAPIRKHLRSTDTRLVVSPDEDLNLVPYAALVDDRGRFLVQDFEVSYVTSGRDLLRIAAMGAQRSSNGKPVVVGDPAFDGSAAGVAIGTATGSTKSTRGDLDNARFPPLPGTAVEVKAISEILAASTYTQGEATKARLAGVTSPLVLHVATHGFFLTKQKDPAGGDTRGLAYDPGGSTILPPRTENPLVRSGLALAGANKKGSADGLLTALEASSMSLDGTRLVVLSACETGIGQTEVGDGVYGLRRALVVAGSETQVMSLWKVDDDATRDLMIAFYKELKAGTGRAAALRKVQIAMLARRETQHPYFWAAFIPSGAWGPMGFTIQPSSASSPSSPSSPGVSSAPDGKDRAPSSRRDDEPERKRAAGSLALGLHHATLTNLDGQPDRVAAMLGLTLEHELLGDYVGREKGFGFHDAVNLAVYAGARLSDGARYADGEEGSLAGGFRSGYEMALGMRGASYSVFAGAQAMYTTLLLGDARTYGLTLPLIALVDFRVGSTFVGLRGSYGRFLVDQEMVGAALSLTWGEAFLLAGIEQLRMPASVSLDGRENQASAGRQTTSLVTAAIGARF